MTGSSSGRARPARGTGARAAARPGRPARGGRGARTSGSRVLRVLGPATRRVPRVAAHPAVLGGAAAVALVLGVATGWAADAATRGAAPDPSATATTSPEQCAAAQVAWTQSASAQVAMSEADPASLRTGFVAARDALAGVEAPAGAAADWQTVVTYVTTLAAAVEGVDPADGTAVLTAVGGALQGLDTVGMTTASQRVTAFLQAGCTAVATP